MNKMKRVFPFITYQNPNKLHLNRFDCDTAIDKIKQQ